VKRRSDEAPYTVQRSVFKSTKNGTHASSNMISTIGLYYHNEVGLHDAWPLAFPSFSPVIILIINTDGYERTACWMACDAVLPVRNKQAWPSCQSNLNYRKPIHWS